MERPERMICLIAGALLDQLELALWVLAILANITALQRIVVTRRLMSEPPVLRSALLTLLLVPSLAVAAESPSALPRAVTPEQERVWAQAIDDFQDGDPGPVATEFATDAARHSAIGDHLTLILADALARRGDLSGARAAALSVASHDHRQPHGAPGPADGRHAGVASGGRGRRASRAHPPDQRATRTRRRFQRRSTCWARRPRRAASVTTPCAPIAS